MRNLKYLIGAGIIYLAGCNPSPPPIPEIPSLPPVSPTPIEGPIENPIEEPEPEPESEPVRDDFYINITTGQYQVGDIFTYGVRVQNKHLEDISLSSEIGKSTWSLIKDGKKLKTDSFPDDLYVTLKEQGYVEIEQLEGEMKLTTENTRIVHNGIPYELPFEVEYVFDTGNFIFKKEGTHFMEFLAKYVLEGETYTAKYQKEFEVSE